MWLVTLYTATKHYKVINKVIKSNTYYMLRQGCEKEKKGIKNSYKEPHQYSYSGYFENKSFVFVIRN